MEIINRKVNDLIPYDKNPRKNDEAVKYVKASIEQFGFKVPIVIDADGVIVAGHTRLKAAKELGMKEVPCIVADDLTPEQIRAFRVADNKTAEIAEWDIELLNTELLDLEANFDMADFGFEINEPTGEVSDDDFDADAVADAIVEPVTKLGDIWTLGRHRLMCGDSTDRETVDRLMDGQKADISFTSPPYNAGTTPTEVKANKSSKYINSDDDLNEQDYKKLLVEFTKNALNNSQYCFVNIQSLSNNKTALIDYLYELRDVYADTIIWDKMMAQPAMAKNVMNSEFEYVHVFSEKANRSIGTKEFRGTLSNILHLKKQNNNEYSKIHNATFPIDFASYFINNFSSESALDLFGGSGTTLVACEQLNRTCYMMELDPKYCDVIIKRWESLTGQKAVLNG